jgi:rhamnosyltransferase subunit B
MTQRPRFVFEGVGSRGDIAPLIEIAAELVRRGHEAHVLGNQRFEAEAIARGVTFTATTTRAVVCRGDERYDRGTYLFPALDQVAGFFRQAPARPSLVVNIDRFSASNLLCEAYGHAAVRLHLSPFKIRSLVRPPWPLSRRCEGPLGQAYLKYTLPRFYEACDNDPRIVRHINQQRRWLGLPSVSSAATAETYLRGELGLFPSWYCSPASDWPATTQLVGFPRAEPATELPRPLSDFIAREGRPLVFTPGTSFAETSDFFAAARACCELLELPGVFLSPHARGDVGADERRFLQLDYADLGALLPLARLLVHHGGVGTTAQGLAAGVAQIVSPLGFDQPDNAERVRSLGVGTVIERSALSGRALADSARLLLASEGVQRRAGQLRQLSAETDGLQTAADWLEQNAASGSTISSATAPVAQTRSDARVVLFISWPELGHLVTPFALARQLRERGDRVVFAGAPLLAARVEARGFEFCDLSGGDDASLFSIGASGFCLKRAVDGLVSSFEAALARYRPALVLIDSLYAAFGILAAAHGITWAQYETDLPRELDPALPPSGSNIVPSRDPDTQPRLRKAWADTLWAARRSRHASRKQHLRPTWSMTSAFPDALLRELTRRYGKLVGFRRATLYPPTARAPRLVFCPREFDFPRERSDAVVWADPCIDEARAEPDFDWQDIPNDRAIAYCAFGSQSFRSPLARGLLRLVVDVFSQRDDFFLILACPPDHAASLSPNSARVRVVSRAPQLSLLRRSRLAITHAGFNSVKECALYGVPMLALPLSHDQPRNAALIGHHGIGIALDSARLTAEELDLAVTCVRDSEPLRERCRQVQRLLEIANREQRALHYVDALLGGARASLPATQTPTGQ